MQQLKNVKKYVIWIIISFANTKIIFKVEI